jgi:hypothetical protein
MATKKTKVKKAKKPVQFYTWLRSGLRSLSRKWPPVYEALAAAKVSYKGDNKRRQYSYVCAMCAGEFEGKSVRVDHVQPAGALACKGDVGDFVERLFCSTDGLQVLCSPCHDAKTYQEKFGGTIEEAAAAKNAIAFMKQPPQIILDYLQSRGHNGTAISNAAKRKALITIIFKEKQNDIAK